MTEKKEASFKMTYADSGYLYLCVGYGKQDSGGYSITVDDLYASGGDDLSGYEPDRSEAGKGAGRNAILSIYCNKNAV